MTKVRQMQGRTGQPVANQFIIRDDNTGWEVFQSYNSTICKKGDDGTVLLDKHYWDYSVTTSKYRNQFLGIDTATTKRRIKSGEIQLVELN